MEYGGKQEKFIVAFGVRFIQIQAVHQHPHIRLFALDSDGDVWLKTDGDETWTLDDMKRKIVNKSSEESNGR